MEGPSIFLAVERLAPFIGKKILAVQGNTRIGKERLLNNEILAIFSWGKHLIFQFENFALRIHFMLYGTYQANVKGKMVSGDYPRKHTPPRLLLSFDIGEIAFFSCSLEYQETSHAQDNYDYSVDIMDRKWNIKKALKTVLTKPEAEIGDLILDQAIFAGAGNIIKNEVLFLVRKLPFTQVNELSLLCLKKIIKTVRAYAFQFYRWHKRFALRKHYQVYRRSYCPLCHGKITRKKTGIRERISFYCTHCQK